MIKLQRKVDRDYRQYELDAWMNLHLGMGQLKALFFIINPGITSTSNLANAITVTPIDVTGIIKRLLEKNMITRNGDLSDRRVILLRTIPQGDDLVAELR